ncbi:FixH family protein [Stieleria sp. TO1_6]|uniref:FixH family protein n=1 Tax=Stieleria tagensis TaxID=2956795 RepID=UPI00209B8E2E|nr:FixH family protein [Stieleria tagensis]MCO8123859.1 FixH family protein [Stieleria tagensis]
MKLSNLPDVRHDRSFAIVIGLCLVLTAILVAGCAPQPSETTNDLRVDVTLSPSPPVVGNSSVTLQVSDTSGEPVAVSDLQIEGNMNHAGMKPSFAEMQAVGPGHYEGTLDFTMGGDWFLLVTATTSSGATIERKIDVPEVGVQ